MNELIDYTINDQDDAPNCMVINYWKGAKDMTLLLNVPDLIEYLMKTSLIDYYDIGDNFEDATIMIDSWVDPIGFETDEERYLQVMTLQQYLHAFFNDYCAQKLVDRHENIKDTDGVKIVDIMENIKTICDDYEEQIHPLDFPSEAFTNGAKAHKMNG